jgi:hypothetical protein
MKIGDRVYVVSHQVSIGNGTAGEVATLNGSIAEVGIRFATGPAVFTVKAWDLLPANLYTQSVLNAVYQTVQSIERETGSILNLSRSELIQKLIENGLIPQAASQCADLFDAADWERSRLPLHQWLTRIRDFYFQQPVGLGTERHGELK